METSKVNAYAELRSKYSHSRDGGETTSPLAKHTEPLMKGEQQQFLNDLKKHVHYKVDPVRPDENPQSSNTLNSKRPFREDLKKFVHLTDDDEIMDQPEDFLEDLKMNYKHQPCFLQAVEEMAKSLEPLFLDPEKGELFKRSFLLLTEPERIISFRVNWENDQGQLQTNRGWRVEFSRYLFKNAYCIV